jgi:site-specific recombinase XerD
MTAAYFEHQREAIHLKMNRNALILSILTNQGVTASEFENIETGDVDLVKATLNIRGTRQSNSRTLPLKATQIGLFMHYLQNTRPQLLEYQKYESEKLFLPLPKGNQKKTGNSMLLSTFNKLIEQVKTIDKQFINFKQVRASLITFWIKTYGLRKAQYMAGHRYISSTEAYLPNNLEDLKEDINKLHPF